MSLTQFKTKPSVLLGLAKTGCTVTEPTNLSLSDKDFLGKLLCSLTTEKGAPVIAGGFVRDIQLGRQPKDIDIFMPYQSNFLLAYVAMKGLGAIHLKDCASYADEVNDGGFNQEVKLVMKFELDGYLIDIIFLNFESNSLGFNEETGGFDYNRLAERFALHELVFDRFDFPCNMQALVYNGKKFTLITHPDAMQKWQVAVKPLSEERLERLRSKLYNIYNFKV